VRSRQTQFRSVPILSVLVGLTDICSWSAKPKRGVHHTRSVDGKNLCFHHQPAERSWGPSFNSSVSRDSTNNSSCSALWWRGHRWRRWDIYGTSAEEAAKDILQIATATTQKKRFLNPTIFQDKPKGKRSGYSRANRKHTKHTDTHTHCWNAEKWTTLSLSSWSSTHLLAPCIQLQMDRFLIVQRTTTTHTGCLKSKRRGAPERRKKTK
jgi:hypothetical protein